MVKLSQKRRGQPGASTSQPTKKRKVDASSEAIPRKVRTVPKKEKAAHRKTIPIPADANEPNDGDESEADADDIAFFTNEAQSASFLNTLDKNAIARSKHESDRLHKMNKPARVKSVVDDDLPSIHSHSEDEGLWDSDIESYDLSVASDAGGIEDDSASSQSSSDSESELELEERYVRKQKKPAYSETETGAERLPIKMPDGKLKKRGYLPVQEVEGSSDEDDGIEDATRAMEQLAPPREDISTGARFGRPAVTAVIGTKSRKARIQAAKEQLASICQEVVADPENSIGLLRRLNSFSLPSITTPTHPKPVQNDPIIRKLAMLSQLAVFKDIIPAYRIRALTDKEKEEKVSQQVQRQRDYEQGLVGVYQNYLRTLEQDLKSKTELFDTALSCLCSLLQEIPHFNFRLNIMSALVAQLSRRSWPESSEICLKTFISVLQHDQSGDASLELVRLLNRMIKERKFNVHPNALGCLLHLRLKSELGVKASDTKVDRDLPPKPDRRRRADKKYDPKAPHLSKKAKKAEKERKEIQQELYEAEVEVDREERSKTHTETLKLLFVLYFRILKSPHRTPLLPAALVGISKFAHLVNIDFFKDLLATLRTLITREGTDLLSELESDEKEEDIAPVDDLEVTRHRLLCIVTAFELLTGQGEALSIDLADFVNFLYGILIDLALVPNIEDVASQSQPLIGGSGTPVTRTKAQSSMSDLLFRALSLVFITRSAAHENPSWRSAAFAKRLMISALSWPPHSASRAIAFVRTLLVRDPALEALLSTEERVSSGVYKAEVPDPQLSGALHAANFWELRVLARDHWDVNVRTEAQNLVHFTR
ncbi:NOC3p-domain-containing protein [Clavulina sp. PMI_390]|nr:NOC3p-domain-containing protein [Clavulina sp. PMI_390]